MQIRQKQLNGFSRRRRHIGLVMVSKFTDFSRITVLTGKRMSPFYLLDYNSKFEFPPSTNLLGVGTFIRIADLKR